MTEDRGVSATHIPIQLLHEAHPRIRAEDWRSPLIARLIDENDYVDGMKAMECSYRDENDSISDCEINLTWSGLKSDYDKCINTYQGTVLTEYAALAVACILCNENSLEITEVTRRGEKVDYWIGDRESLIEVSGTKTGNLGNLCDLKANGQLLVNPYDKDGYVCVARFATPAARLWYYRRVQ